MRLADHSSSHQKTIGRETNAPYDCSAPQCVFRIRGSDHLFMSRSTRCGKAITPVVVSSFVGRLNLEVLRSWALDLRFRSIITLIVGISSPHSCHSPLHSGPLFLTPVWDLYSGLLAALLLVLAYPIWHSAFFSVTTTSVAGPLFR